MAEQGKLGIVSRSLLANGLTDEESEVVAAITNIKELVDGELLVEENGDDATLYIVADGALDVVKSVGGIEEKLHTLRAHELAGVLGVVREIKRTAGLRASGPTTVLGISKERFEGLLYTHPRILYNLMCSIVEASHDIVRRMNLNQVEMNNYIRHSHGRY